MLGHKLSLNRFNKTDIIQSIFYDREFYFHLTMKLENKIELKLENEQICRN